jgi:hypothetical protein
VSITGYSPILPKEDEDVLIFCPNWSSKWIIGWFNDGKWYTDVDGDDVACISDFAGCEVVLWVPLPPIPEPWRTQYDKLAKTVFG